jgi:uncharacterized repeat protein (TIGR03803 family)
VFQISHMGSNWSYAPILIFSGQAGTVPVARVVFGPDNRLYGTTYGGGSQGWGTVFSLGPAATICKNAACSWVEKVIYEFQGSPDAGYPGLGDLVWDSMGNMYGSTRFGGTSDLGTVFQMKKSGNIWTEAPIYSFTGLDGIVPPGGVILDGNGNLYGTTGGGGAHNLGTIFELTYTSGVGWTETVLYNFQNLSDGQYPGAGLIRDSAGNFYGSTTDGGSGRGGTIFELSPVGDSWVFATLYSFSGNPGCGPLGALALDISGNLYGSTLCDGSNRLGNIFKLTNTQNGWEYISLHDFTGGGDGARPISNVAIDIDGTLYGTAEFGGNDSCNPPTGCGTVWMIKP